MTETGGAGAAAGPDSYEAAVERLEEIILRLDSGKAELRETLDLCREGKTLVEYCKGELDAVSGELQRLDLDDLVRKLEAGEGAADSDAGADSDGGEGAADSDAVPS
ncbi:MAG: exodeoxyribonuclease VII small subunit [Solirubrobacterales bacterium]